jgi:hypothetical protein
MPGWATTGWKTLGYVHERRSQRAARARGDDPGELLPAVHRVASLAKRWLLSTHQGSVDEAHLQGYLDEFVFRFNRRRSRSRGLVFYRVLKLAVGHRPGALPQHRCRQAATKDPADPASHARTSAEPGAPGSGAPVEGRLPGPLRLNGDPQGVICARYPVSSCRRCGRIGILWRPANRCSRSDRDCREAGVPGGGERGIAGLAAE